MEAQLQIRNNAQDAQEYMKELYQWEKEQKQKEENMRRNSQRAGAEGTSAKSSSTPQRGGRETSQEASAEPSPRPQGVLESTNETSGRSARTREQGNTAKGTSSSHAAAHTHSHSASKWEKFDVDAALAELSDTSDSETKGSGLVKGKQSGEALVQHKEGKENLRALHTTRTVPASAPAPRAVPPRSKSASEPVDPPITATEWKDEGNRLFNRGRYMEAKKAYTMSIDAGGGSVLYANRAMASLKLQDFRSAEADCTKCLEMDSSFIKAWQRRGAARKALGHLREAAEDFEQALRLSPASKAIHEDFMACVALLEKQERVKHHLPRERVHVRPSEQQAMASTSGQLAHTLAEDNEVVAIESERGMRPSTAMDLPQPGAVAPAKGIAIADAAVPQGSCRQESTNPAPGPEELGERASQLEGEQTVLASDERQMRPLPPSAAHRETHGDLRREDQAQLGERMGAAAPTQETSSTHKQLLAPSVGSVAPSNGQVFKTIQVDNGATHKVPKAEGMASPNNRRPAMEPLAQVVSDRPASNGALQHPAPVGSSTPTPKSAGVPAAMPLPMSGHTAQKLPAPPRTGIEFEAAWKGFKKDIQKEGAYLQHLNPSSLPLLFKHSMTSPLLAQLLLAILRVVAMDRPDHARDLLQALQQVPRFNLVVLGISKSQKEQLSKVWDEAAGLQDLRQIFKI